MFDCYLDESRLVSSVAQRQPREPEPQGVRRGHPKSYLALSFTRRTESSVRQQLLQQIAKLVAEPIEYVHGDYHVRAVTLEQALQINRLVADQAHLEVHVVAGRPALV
ncbi:hypothetical protein ABWL39_16575 [Chitinivorax sp. PXF-14]|uniref:hypothetical protein n=1 Tax=Chitinivorax sp. PXF-14 TaxID=3230488 RepID=UPI0034670354